MRNKGWERGGEGEKRVERERKGENKVRQGETRETRKGGKRREKERQ